MARPLLMLTLAMQNPSSPSKSVTFLFVTVSVLAMFSITAFLCASHRNRGLKKKGNEGRMISKINSNLGSKAEKLMTKMISWRRVQADDDDDDEEEEDYDEAAVWRKRIMMGERCRPLDFSGKIVYDAQGNLLPPSDSSAHGDV